LGKGNINVTQRLKENAFLQEANATLKKLTWLTSSTNKKNERAAESLTKAADAYRAGGCYNEAGQTYWHAAALHKDRLKNSTEAGK
jgi:hypothetical protein